MSSIISRLKITGLLIMLCSLHALGTSQADSQVETDPKLVRTALERLNSLIGEWRGTGQLRRGSTRGAWRQTGEFVWDFSKPLPTVKYIVKNGKLAEEGLISWNSQDKYSLHLKTDQQERQYRGEWEDGKLVLVSQQDAEEIRYRMTITPLNEKRSLVLHEKTSAGGSAFFRVAEVGYTREGTRLALPGGGKRECIVTGGTGETAVTYQGETYYVCCTGCKQAFEDDPAGIIADFKARVKERLNSIKN